MIDQIRTGIYRRLFHPLNLVTGNEDAANNFARGFYSVGRDLLPVLQERTRKLCEQANSVSTVFSILTFSNSRPIFHAVRFAVSSSCTRWVAAQAQDSPPAPF